MKILVVGGAGYIGSYVNKALHRAGFDTVVFDNLCHGNRDAVVRGKLIVGDAGNPSDLENVLAEGPFDGIMHFAAHIDVGASMREPYEYYRNNVSSTLTLLHALKDVKRVVFSSSAGIFGMPQSKTIGEDHPCNPINPYGHSKLVVEGILKGFDEAYGLKSIALRYFNAAGADPDGEIKLFERKESNLIPIILRSLRRGENKVTIFGTDYPTPDGSCVRDYIHIHDLAQAHVLALKSLLKGGDSAKYNLGNGQGYSVREVIAAVRKVTQEPLTVIEGERRPGDPPALVASARKAQLELGWSVKYPELETMIAHAWQCLL